jgi:GH24 family phage-related lysozyme (muramidase)
MSVISSQLTTKMRPANEFSNSTLGARIRRRGLKQAAFMFMRWKQNPPDAIATRA